MGSIGLESFPYKLLGLGRLPWSVGIPRGRLLPYIVIPVVCLGYIVLKGRLIFESRQKLGLSC